MSTDSTTGARDHARSQVRTATMRIPATPPDVDPSRLLWAEAVPPGSYATRVLGRGTRLRLIDPDGGACAHLLLFRSDAPWERLNVADTVKVPWQAYLGAGHPLLSDQGRVLATVVADSSGHHDTLCGMTDAGRAKMLLAAIKHGLDIRDVAPSVSLFKGVRVGDDGALGFTGSAGPGAAVDLLIHLPDGGRAGQHRPPAGPRPGAHRPRRAGLARRRTARHTRQRRSRILARPVQHRKHLGRSANQ